MINTVSFHWFSQNVYENVLQNVLTNWMSRKSRNFSQISPRRAATLSSVHTISNYFSIQSMGAVEILQVGISIKILTHKGNPPPPPHMEKMASKRKTKAPQKEKRGTLHGEKNTHSFAVSRGAPRSECDYIKCTMLPEIIHHIIISKYTLECTQLKFLLKKSIPSNPLAD